MPGHARAGCAGCALQSLGSRGATQTTPPCKQRLGPNTGAKSRGSMAQRRRVSPRRARPMGADADTLEVAGARARPLGHVLITGGAGFLGRRLAAMINERACAEDVLLFDVRTPEMLPAGARFLKGDLRILADCIVRALTCPAPHEPESIEYHVAHVTIDSRSIFPALFNVILTCCNLLSRKPPRASTRCFTLPHTACQASRCSMSP